MAKEYIGKSFWQNRSLIHCKYAPGLSVDFQNKLMAPDDLLKEARLIKDSHATTAGVFEFNGQQYFVKRSNVASWLESIRRIGRLSRARRNWIVTEFLQKNKLRVPEIYLARWQKRLGLWPESSYLVMEYIPEPMNAADLFTELYQLWGVDGFIECLVEKILFLHRHGVKHGDLKMVNFLAQKDPESGNIELGLFDFDGTVLYRKSCSVKVRTVELARAASSFFLTMRYLKIDPETTANTIARKFWDIYSQQIPQMANADYDFYMRRINKHIVHYEKRQG